MNGIGMSITECTKGLYNKSKEEPSRAKVVNQLTNDFSFNAFGIFCSFTMCTF